MADRRQVLARPASMGARMLSMCWLGVLLRMMACRKLMSERMVILVAEMRLALRVVGGSRPSPCRCPAYSDAHFPH